MTPSITVVPDTSVLTFHVCGGSSGRVARVSMRTNAVSRTAARANATRVRAEVQPCAAVPPRPNISAARPPIDGERARHVELAEAGAGGASLREQVHPGEQGDDADGDVDPEDELPAGPGGEGAAEQDAGGDAEAADGAPQGEARWRAARRSRWS